MFDNFNRRISYLRVSVTDRCNLRCTYCMPCEGVQLLNHNDILTFEEITSTIKAGVELGIEKVRLTGGEPLVRKGIVELVTMLSQIEGIKDLSLTTNGQLLERYAQPLAKAGLQRVNVSLDTMDPDVYRQMSRGGEIEPVLKGIEAAREAGLLPIKINCVISGSAQDKDAVDVAAFCAENDLHIRYIHQMDLENGDFSVVEGGEGGDCSICNRLRLTANGMIKPCLFNDLEYNVRELGPEEAFRLALGNKPACGTNNMLGKFYNIGG
ncbi:MAG TPA: radical SAM protein [Bacteroidales bacterium]